MSLADLLILVLIAVYLRVFLAWPAVRLVALLLIVGILVVLLVLLAVLLGEFNVYSESGSVYRVCLITETCDCPSATYQDGACKHQRRVEMALGQRDVPDLDEETDVEMMIAACEEYRGLSDSTVEHRPADDAVVVTDGGVATETTTQDNNETLITGPHLEPPEQGGATYYRCEDCGRESLRRGDVEHSEFHAEGCALR